MLAPWSHVMVGWLVGCPPLNLNLVRSKTAPPARCARRHVLSHGVNVHGWVLAVERGSNVSARTRGLPRVREASVGTRGPRCHVRRRSCTASHQPWKDAPSRSCRCQCQSRFAVALYVSRWLLLWCINTLMQQKRCIPATDDTPTSGQNRHLQMANPPYAQTPFSLIPGTTAGSSDCFAASGGT